MSSHSSERASPYRYATFHPHVVETICTLDRALAELACCCGHRCRSACRLQALATPVFARLATIVHSRLRRQGSIAATDLGQRSAVPFVGSPAGYFTAVGRWCLAARRSLVPLASRLQSLRIVTRC